MRRWAHALVTLVLTAAMVAMTALPASAGTVHGTVDLLSSPAPGTLWLRGWAFDDGVPAAQLQVHVYVGGPAGSGAPGYNIGAADQYRPDVHAVYGTGEYHGIDRTLSVWAHGTQEVWVYFIGSTMNASFSRTVSIADVPPETTITSGPPARGTATAVRFSFAGAEANSFRCRMDQGPWQACASPLDTSVAVGDHVFAVQATNAAGTTDPSPATYAFSVVAPPAPPPPVTTPPPPAARTIGLDVRAVRKKSRLRIDIDPDLEQSNYALTVQRRAGKKWRTVRRTQTLGPQDAIEVDLPRGTYRVVVPAQHDMLGVRATARLKR